MRPCYIRTLTACLMLTCMTAIGQDEADSSEMEQLLAVLEQQTEIATKSRLNADYVPGMVTVLHGDELESRGIRNVSEALNLVPGIESDSERNGNPLIRIRGTGGAFASGNIKILLDSVATNASLTAMATPVLHLPIEQVERIEVIRGPGSAIHGEFAYAGVVNVITRQSGDRLFASAGSFDTYSGGGVLSRRGEDYDISLNFAASRSDGADLSTGPDVMHGLADYYTAVLGTDLGVRATSNAPGEASQDRVSQNAMLNLRHREFRLQLQLLQDGQAEGFGATYALPDPSDRIAYENTHFNLEMTQDIDISEHLSSRVRLGGMYFQNDYEVKIFPDGSPYIQPDFTLAILENGWLGRGHYEEQRLHGGIDLSWSGWQDHTWLLGWSYSHTRVLDAWQRTNIDPATNFYLGEPQRFTGDENWVDQNQTRSIHSLTLQDEFRAHEDITLTAGLRFDDYSDIGSNLSPRFAAVYRASRHHIIKAQYAQAFRPPNFYETWRSASSASLSPQTIDTFELGYIYRRPDTLVRTVLFHSRLKDLIREDAALIYTNTQGARLQGIELELEQRIGPQLSLDAGYAYVDTQDTATGRPIAGAASWLGNLGLTYQPKQDWNISALCRLTGDYTRQIDDPREDLDGHATLDLTASIKNIGGSGLNLRAGIRNLTDAEYRTPAPLTQFRGIGSRIITYPDDFPQPGRVFWLQASVEL